MMRKLSFLILAVSMLALSCSKKDKTDNGNKEYHLTFKVDGVQKTMAVGATAGRYSQDGEFGIGLYGASSLSLTPDYFGLFLWKESSDFGPGTYTVSSGDHQIYASYATLSDEKNYVAGDLDLDESGTPLTVVITQIDGNTIKGTFSGDFFEISDDDSPVKKTITDGSFYLEIDEDFNWPS